MKRTFSENLRYVRQITLIVLTIFVFCMLFNFDVLKADAASVPTPKIKSCSYVDQEDYSDFGSESLKMVLECPKIYGNYDLQIYRSTSKDGGYTLYDEILSDGVLGENCNSKCMSDDSKTTVVYLYHIKLNKKYYYKVRLIDGSGNMGSFSGVAAYTHKLPPVDIVQCYGASSTTAKLSWTAMEGADGYLIYRKAPGGKWKKIKTIKKWTTVSFTDKKLKSGKTYSYRMYAYWNSGSSMKKGVLSATYKAKTSSPTVSGDYKNGSTYRLSSSKSKRTAVRRVVQGFKDNYIKSGMSKYDKLLAAFNYMQNNCRYASSSEKDIDNAYGALVKGRAQCGGYACAMMALCDSINVPCRFIRSNDNSKMRHRWNEVKIGGKWYIIDSQGGLFLVGSKTFKGLGWDWNAKDYPTVSTKCYKKGFPNLDEFF